jgi:hypothetical protein
VSPYSRAKGCFTATRPSVVEVLLKEAEEQQGKASDAGRGRVGDAAKQRRREEADRKELVTK